MGIGQSILRINYNDMQNATTKSIATTTTLIINTLKEDEQQCLIQNTLMASSEVNKINDLLMESQFSINIFIYGKNSDDSSTIDKYMQLKKLGFRHVYIYTGGLFEWLLLQDIYGDGLFPTTTTTSSKNLKIDLLKFAPISQFSRL